MIGRDHVHRLTSVIAGSEVVAVTDIDSERAREVADALPDVRIHATGQDVIIDDDVDGVLVASWGQAHEEFVLACIEAGKPVFCEKPLATTQAACLRIMEAEVALGRRLVQVGFMRRYDAAYRALKDVVASGSIGTPLLMHCAHRNADVPAHYTGDMAITDTAVHEFDIVRWLFEEEIVAVTVLRPRRSGHGGSLQDPLFLLLETESGVLVDIETSVNIRYGYDVRGEVVGEDGTASLGDGSPVIVRRNGSVQSRVPTDWRERFQQAYDVELANWVGSNAMAGPSTWDGYAAAVVSDAALEALHTGAQVAVRLRDTPNMYVKSINSVT
jgi:myo-inositol 2-dehydrogenase/D-chiro-inositol 1-dehydrogenase